MDQIRRLSDFYGGRAQELCESRDGRPGLPVPNKPDGFCGRKATLKLSTVDTVVVVVGVSTLPK